MRSLREKLIAVSSKAASVSTSSRFKHADAYYVREHRVSLDQLSGIEKTTLDEICACDPGFSGKHWDVRKLLFLDTETTGLSGGAGTIAFEIGIGYLEEDYLVIKQYVMRDYSEEAAMLSDIAGFFDRFDTLVTFNGKTFDIPLLESRMIMQRIKQPISSLPHFDLLHACRRVYKLRLKRCSLAALEEAVLGEKRSDDLPGAMVPQRYFDYLKTHEFVLLEDVLRHNLQDVQSLAALTGHLCSVFRNPEMLDHPEDLFSVGKTFERGGNVCRARKCYRILGHSTISSRAHMHLALSYKKEKEWEEALLSWNTMISRREGGSWPYIEAAKYYEHVQREYTKALDYARSGLAYEVNYLLLSANDEQIEALQKRIKRLTKKQRMQLYQSTMEDE